MSQPDGGTAFPLPAGNPVVGNGMSLRDWFAGMALQGILAGRIREMEHKEIYGFDECAQRALKYADAMLKERDK